MCAYFCALTCALVMKDATMTMVSTAAIRPSPFMIQEPADSIK